MNGKVSILVPIYNVEKNIERCVVSLFKQTYKNIEFIFVNDCTPDNSIEILKQVIERFSEIKDQVYIINLEENKGIAEVRNTALDNAKGEFILFVDSDDYIEIDMVSLMYNRAMTENADIVVCDYLIEWKNKSLTSYQKINNDKIKTINSLLELDTMPAMWNKLIRRSLFNINDLRFTKGRNMGEDYMIMPKLFYYANKIIKIDNALYHYLQLNPSAYTRSFNQKHKNDIIYSLQELTRFFEAKEDYQIYKDSLIRGKLKNKMNMLFLIDKNHISELLPLFPETNTIDDNSFLLKRDIITHYLIKNNYINAFVLYRYLYKLLYNIKFNLRKQFKKDD